VTRVLVVDDDAMIGDALRRVLEAEGYAVTTATSVSGAMAAMADRPAHIVITDVIMPRQNGADLIDRLKSAYPSVRIVAISGGGGTAAQNFKPQAITTHAFLAAATAAGADVALRKPFSLEELRSAVRRLADA
jgi:DNA-binding response OmpR family regulator